MNSIKKNSPPCAEKFPISSNQHGYKLIDPYDWIRDDNWQEVLHSPNVLKKEIRDYIDKENQWYEINKDVTNIAKKVKYKIDEEDLVEDLKDSFKKTVESTTEIFKTLINTLESTINDEELKQDSKKVVENISSEPKSIINDTKSKFTGTTDVNNNSEEE